MDEPPSLFLLDITSLELNPFYLFSFVTIAVLLGISGLISASEVAFFSLRANDLDRCRELGDSKGANIIKLLKHPRSLLATILIANNFVNVGVVTLATFLMWEMAATHRPSETVVGIVTLATTFAITFFGEVVPKVYATQRNMAIARQTAGPWIIIGKICRPVSFLLIRMGGVIERRINKVGYNSTVEELHQAVEMTTDNPETTDDEKEILKGIVNFGTLTVKQVMKSRMELSSVDVNIDFLQLLESVGKSGFSRIPVFRGTIDHIEGILYTKDLLPYLGESKVFQWQRLLRPGFFVPETKRLDSLLKDFQSKRVHIAIVADEYGGTSGLVTLEDLIEEIIGEINDEYDEVSTLYQKIDDKTYVFEGRVSIHDFCKTFNLDPQFFDSVKGENESLGGLMLEWHNRMPEAGDRISFEGFEFTILTASEKRINRIHVRIAEAEKGEEK